MILVDTTDIPATFATIHVELGDGPTPDLKPGEAVSAGEYGLTLSSARADHHPRVMVIEVHEPSEPPPSPWEMATPLLRHKLLVGPELRVHDAEFATIIDVPWTH